MQVLEGTSPLKMEKKKKITAEIVATTSLPVDRLMATDCNAAARAKMQDFKRVDIFVQKICKNTSTWVYRWFKQKYKMWV